jgi:hypothetical protein
MQTRKGSIIEAVANTAIGWGVNFAANLVVLPWFGFAVTVSDALGIGVVFTVISLARSYVLRRWFNGLRFFHHPPAAAPAAAPALAIPAGGYPDHNPKTAAGASKVPLHLVPPSAKHFLAQAMLAGARKYGPYNWRDASISVSVYRAAAERHWDAFWDGQDLDPETGNHHVAHAMACCGIMLDAWSIGRLIDDRPSAGAAARLQAEFVGASHGR